MTSHDSSVASLGVEHHTVDVNGIQLHIAEAGKGPLVVLLHGFPEFWYSWRHQFAPLVAAGYRVVAPDQRGYGSSGRPEAVDSYTILDLAGDVIGLIQALGEQKAVVVGHDLGAWVAWNTALLRPDMVRGVVGLSVPPTIRTEAPPLLTMRELFDGRFYWNYFEAPGVADAELFGDVRSSIRRVLNSISGEYLVGKRAPAPLVPPGGGFLDLTEDFAELPPWLTEADIDVMTAAFTESGFTGGLNWYRNFDRSWRLTAFLEKAQLQMPGLYIAGEHDLVVDMPGMKEMVASLRQLFPTLGPPVMLPGCGHWTQQERPEAVNDALLTFLDSLIL